MTDRPEALRPDEQFCADVLRGLAAPQKWIPSKYFYDAAGSRLFERITQLDEYYLTRTELAIMRVNAADMATRCGPQCLLVELGAGGLAKVRLLLDKLQDPAGYVPVDVSGSHLRAAARELAEDYPGLEVRPVVADFTRPFALPEIVSSRRVVYFPGSTIGNFEPLEAADLFRRIVQLIGRGGGLLLGVDLVKDTAVLERAYNDATGVTAAFNLNLLQRINRELGADFRIDAFRHKALYNRERSRIEMYLVSSDDQQVHIGPATIALRAGETIRTEHSYKYGLGQLARLAAGSGLRLDETWTDPRKAFAVLYLTAAP